VIYEVRTYPMRPGTVPIFEERLAAALPVRERYSKLAACWHTEIGPLNEAVHVWPYEDLSQRTRARAEAAKHPEWPPKLDDIVIEMRSEIYNEAPFKKTLPPGEYGPVYEMRIYLYQVGSMPTVLERWEEAIGEREKLSPLVALWYSEIGTVNTLIHIWAYKDLNERARIRAEAQKLANWPPKTREFMISQQNKILLPAAFSPLR
jgi:hypothetical protein